MKSLISCLTAAALTAAAAAETYDLHFGTIEAPEDFVFKRTGTGDSFMGTLTRKSDGFTITFDVGWMSGKLMHESRDAKRTYLRKHRIGGLSASTGIEEITAGGVFGNVPDGQLIATTVNIDSKTQRDPEPANFWASIRTNSDIADFLLIVTTYKAKAEQVIAVVGAICDACARMAATPN